MYLRQLQNISYIFIGKELQKDSTLAILQLDALKKWQVKFRSLIVLEVSQIKGSDKIQTCHWKFTHYITKCWKSTHSLVSGCMKTAAFDQHCCLTRGHVMLFYMLSQVPASIEAGDAHWHKAAWKMQLIFQRLYSPLKWESTPVFGPALW